MQANPEPGAAEPVRYARSLAPGQRCELRILDVHTGDERVLASSVRTLFEAPNWHPSGAWVVMNADGLLYRVAADGSGELQLIPATGLPELNNDHVISADGKWHYVSANDWHIYRLPWDGGTAERITSAKDPDRVFRHFLHSISPDGRQLAYVGTERGGDDEWHTRALWVLDLDTGGERLIGDGFSPADGPEFSPDGSWIYFNSEIASTREGHAQLFRAPVHDGPTEQLTTDERVNWFPHVSPDDAWLCYLSYPPGTIGHPADQPVVVRLRDQRTGSVRDLAAFNGGQGTMNVPNWAPDARHIAYVTYPFGQP